MSNLCDELQLYPNQFYDWLKRFFENARLVFANGRKSKAVEEAKNHKIQQLEAKLTRKNEVMAELIEALDLWAAANRLTPYDTAVDLCQRDRPQGRGGTGGNLTRHLGFLRLLRADGRTHGISGRSGDVVLSHRDLLVEAIAEVNWTELAEDLLGH